MAQATGEDEERALVRAFAKFNVAFPGVVGEIQRPSRAGARWVLDVFGVAEGDMRSATRTLAALIVDQENVLPGLDATGVAHSEAATREHYPNQYRKFVLKRERDRAREGSGGTGAVGPPRGPVM